MAIEPTSRQLISWNDSQDSQLIGGHHGIADSFVKRLQQEKQPAMGMGYFDIVPHDFMLDPPQRFTFSETLVGMCFWQVVEATASFWFVVLRLHFS